MLRAPSSSRHARHGAHRGSPGGVQWGVLLCPPSSASACPSRHSSRLSSRWSSAGCTVLCPLFSPIHGRCVGTVEADGDFLVIDDVKVALSHTRDPAEIPFTEYVVGYVYESAGVFLAAEKVQPHLKAGARKPGFSAPAEEGSHTVR